MKLTPLEFVGDAICLSGLTGTKLKCEVLGQYYPFWWGITSGGPRVSHTYPTAIVELNAATGEDYIEETDGTVLGSSGHALELKVRESPNTTNLKVVLVEEDPDCYAHLKCVIRRRWPSVSLDEAEGPIASNSSNVYLLRSNLSAALSAIEQIHLGNALYFFDPLRSVQYSTLESVAGSRIDTFFKTGTEFAIFVFTSDWFLGRKDFAPLPITGSPWTEEEERTVLEADELFGSTEWRAYILTDEPVQWKQNMLIELYRRRLHRWFRYVLPMPFNPKEEQLFHLFLCSNYEAGIRESRDFFCEKTGNPKYLPDNSAAFSKFKALHPELMMGIAGNRKPIEWKILWRVIREHEEGICDPMCRDLRDISVNPIRRRSALQWLENNDYLNQFDVENAWGVGENRYIVNWQIVNTRLAVDPPPALTPLSAVS